MVFVADDDRRPPTLEELFNDPSIIERLSPQNKLWTYDQLRKLPTPAKLLGRKTDKIVNPLRYIPERLGWRPSPLALQYGIKSPLTLDQEKIVRSVVENTYTAVTAAKGVGKTKILAGIVLWFFDTYGPECYVVTTSGSWDQLKDVLWGEIRRNFKMALKPLPGICMQSEIRADDKWAIVSLSTRADKADMSATRFQGYHAPHVLVAVDEAVKLSEEQWLGAEGIIMNPETDRLVAVANPTNPTSPFRSRCLRPGWNHIEISAYDHPNVVHDAIIIPGAVTKEKVAETILQYGESGPGYLALVLGKWPDSAGNAVIPLDAYEAAVKRFEQWIERDLKEADDHRGLALGLDIAREGGDLSVLYACQNGLLQPVKVVAKRDSTYIEGMIITYVNENHARSLALDDTSIGGLIGDHLREAQRKEILPPPSQFRIMGLNFGQTAFAHERYNRLKDQLWWEMSQDMQAGKIAHPSDKFIRQYLPGVPITMRVADQFVRPIYDLDSRGRIDVFDKREVGNEKTTSLPTKSPDFAHAAMLARFAWAMIQPVKVVEGPKTTEEVVQKLYKEALLRDIQNYNCPRIRRRRYLA